jgi:hypothetical protein
VIAAATEKCVLFLALSTFTQAEFVVGPASRSAIDLLARMMAKSSLLIAVGRTAKGLVPQRI